MNSDKTPDEEERKKIESYRDGKSIYGTSTIKNIWLDLDIREKLDEIQHNRKQKAQEDAMKRMDQSDEDEFSLNF